MQRLSYENLFYSHAHLVHLHVNKTNFDMKGFALGLTLKQRRNASRKSTITDGQNYNLHIMKAVQRDQNR